MRTTAPLCSIARALVLGAATLTAACSDTSSPVAPPRAPSLAKGPTPSGPNALPERGRIVFQMAAANPSESDLYSINEDGTGLKRLTYNPYPDALPAASPDGKKIAYVEARDANGLADIVIMNADGSQPKRLTSSGLSFSMFSHMQWSPDGRRIAIALNPSGDLTDWDIYVVSTVNGTMTRVTSSSKNEGWPTWSPDGSRLAFQMPDDNGVSQVYTMRPDGSDITQFTSCATDCGEPAWSPDGAAIAVYDQMASQTVVRFVNDWTLAGGSITGRFAAWAPDAARLVFLDFSAGANFALSTASYNGSGLQVVVPGYSAATLPTWLRK